MYLQNRPLDFGVDYSRLSTLTENYVSSDIEFLVNESSKVALKSKTRISMDIIETVIKNTKPSISIAELKKFEDIKAKMDGMSEQKKSNIGFKL
jgi:transitional endoplasmic reticulum ATPase